ncbi:molybdopterin-dependent oxidoreductase [Frigidibacter oleivorans]|uniref:molybdopterin-dependent oxidoreductase n=1 Tax=Frigidibacter oleivorans TaxID=2487129 RepID=UPI000F8D2BFF|nr:molybdopterin-dependent oxidoreductase [Frigidibacter oleivorans]
MRKILCCCVAMLSLLSPALSRAGEALLEISAPGGPAKSYDLQALQAFAPVEFSTTTIWTEGAHVFTGVPLTVLLADAGITEGEVKAVALNDYAVTISLDDLEDEVPIVAYFVDGKPFPVREKGPLWIVYPYDASPAYRSETAYSRSVWQLTRLVAD